MIVSLIAAINEENVLGWDNQLPWYLPADLRRFKKITMGKPVIMGRKTYESIGKPLPGRKNIIMTRGKDYSAPGCAVTQSPEEALKVAGDVDEIMIIGGAEIYKIFLPKADRIYLTRIKNASKHFADTFFPEFNADEWSLKESETHRDKSRSLKLYPYSFDVLERVHY